MTNNQAALIDRLGAADELPPNPSKGQASDVITAHVNGGQGPKKTGAAADPQPGNPVPMGPSAKQNATSNQVSSKQASETAHTHSPSRSLQKRLIDSLGVADQLPPNATKADASEVIQRNL